MSDELVPGMYVKTGNGIIARLDSIDSVRWRPRYCCTTLSGHRITIDEDDDAPLQQLGLLERMVIEVDR